ncbi:MAG: PLP-dependent transferase [Lachnospiraceae bacterium]|nr:PLP-dependent transferase [Lachnospiraceae bacterium]
MENDKLIEEIMKYSHSFGKNVSVSFLRAEVERRLQEIYDQKNIFISTGGSRAGLLAAITAIKGGGSILAARNCTKEVFDALSLNRRKVRYLYPKELFPDSLIYGSVQPAEVEAALQAHKDIDAVVITSPTLEGVVSDVEAIAKIVHRAGAVLIVDESYGAHFPYHDDFPVSAIYLDADVVVQSPGKTLPIPDQTALVFVNTDMELTRKIKVALNSFTAADASAFLLAGLGYGINWAYDNEKAFTDFLADLKDFRNKFSRIEAVTLMEKEEGIFDLDPSHMVLFSDKMDGQDFALFLEEEQNVAAEAFGLDHMILGNTVLDGKDRLKKIYSALLASTLKFKYRQPKTLSEKQLEQIAILTIQPLDKEYRDFVYITPPGCPLIAPGELFTKQRKEKILEFINKGLNVEIWERYFS